MVNHETQFRRSSMARQSDSWKRIQDDRLPSHHLNSSEQSVRDGSDYEFTGTRPRMFHKREPMKDYKYFEVYYYLRRGWSVKVRGLAPRRRGR